MSNSEIIVSSAAVARLAEIERAIAEAKGIDDISALVRVANIAGAISTCLLKAERSRRIQLDAAEIKLRAERRIGELLRQGRAEGRVASQDTGRPRKCSSEEHLLTLPELDLDRKTSMRCQIEAAVPESTFEAWLERQKADPKGELTTVGLCRLAPKRRKREKPEEPDVADETKEEEPAETDEREPIRIGDGRIVEEFVTRQLEGEQITCPHFVMLKWANGCSFDCAWCYLKGTYRGNTAFRTKQWHEVVQAVLDAHAEIVEPTLLNAGEVCDALAGENDRNSDALALLGVAAKLGKHRILFVTKSQKVKHLLAAPIAWRHYAVLAWSINADAVAKRWEKDAPATAHRLMAAKEASDKGYEVRLRIDPIVPIPGWKEAYEELVESISFAPSRVTLGTPRMVNRSVLSHTWNQEWADFFAERGGWGEKLSTDQRIECYRHLIDALARKGITSVGVCKETARVIREIGTFGKCNCEA